MTQTRRTNPAGRRGLLLAALMLWGSAPFAQEAPSALSETYGNWVVNCWQEETAGRSCQVSQELRQQNTNQRILRIWIVSQAEGAPALATFIVPFGLSLADNPVLVIDEITSLGTAPFRTCLPTGCMARTELDKTALSGMQAGEVMQVILQPLDSTEALTIGVSLSGFAAAWKRLHEINDRS